MVAKEKGGEVVLLHVITVPPQSPYEVGQRYIKQAQEEILDQAVDRVSSHDVPVSAIVRLARKPAKAIIDQVEDNRVDMVVMGWRGSRRHPETIIGTNIDHVMKDADCDVVVLRGNDFTDIQNAFIPVAHPDQAKLMLELGEMFTHSQETQLDLYHFIPPQLEQDEEARQRRVDRIYEGIKVAEEENDENGEERDGEQEQQRPARSINVEVQDNVVSRIVDLSSQYELTMIGAAREDWIHKLVLGTKPEQIAQQAKGRLIIVKRRRLGIQSGIMDLVEFFKSKETPQEA